MRALATRLARTWRALRAAWSRAAAGEVVVLTAAEVAAEALARTVSERETVAARLAAATESRRALDIAWTLVVAVGEAVHDDRLSHRIRRERLVTCCREARTKVLELSASRAGVREAA